MNWPKQAAATAFYGNPSVNNASWQSANLVRVVVPWDMFYAGSPVRKISIHVRCAKSLGEVLDNAWNAIGKSQAEAERRGWHLYGGSYNYRPVRGRKVLSMHAFGAALDFDPAHNGLHSNPKDRIGFTADDPLVKAFKNEGWRWGGDYAGRSDPMHFEAVSG